MTTHAALLKLLAKALAAKPAAKKRVVKRKTAKRKVARKNPAPRIGTAKPKRASQATGRAPTKRLVSRRKSNVKKGYFPNPSEVARAHSTPQEHFPYGVEMYYKNSWLPRGRFLIPAVAKDFARLMGKKHPDKMYRVVKY